MPEISEDKRDWSESPPDAERALPLGLGTILEETGRRATLIEPLNPERRSDAERRPGTRA